MYDTEFSRQSIQRCDKFLRTCVSIKTMKTMCSDCNIIKQQSQSLTTTLVALFVADTMRPRGNISDETRTGTPD